MIKIIKTMKLQIYVTTSFSDSLKFQNIKFRGIEYLTLTGSPL